jgi:hypothetical protein
MFVKLEAQIFVCKIVANLIIKIDATMHVNIVKELMIIVLVIVQSFQKLYLINAIMYVVIKEL